MKKDKPKPIKNRTYKKKGKPKPIKKLNLYENLEPCTPTQGCPVHHNKVVHVIHELLQGLS